MKLFTCNLIIMLIVVIFSLFSISLTKYRNSKEREWPFFEVHRAINKSDYMGDTQLSFSPFAIYTPLVVPQPKKKSKLDELPIIWSDGPKKGQIMTVDDFPKPYGSKYSEYVTLFLEKSKKNNNIGRLSKFKNSKNLSQSKIRKNKGKKLIIDPRKKKQK